MLLSSARKRELENMKPEDTNRIDSDDGKN